MAASSRLTVSLEGFDEIRRSLERLPDATRAVLSDVIAKSTFAAKQRAVALAPVGEGRLRNAIQATSRGMYGRVIITDPEIFYWRFLEYGTVKMAARPFVRPAAEMETAAFVERVRQAAQRLEHDWKTGGGLL